MPTLLIAGVLAIACGRKSDQQDEVRAVSSAQASGGASASASAAVAALQLDAAPTNEAATIALARFKGDNLTECIESAVEIAGRPMTADPKRPRLTSQQVALLLWEDVWAFSESGASTIADDKAQATAFVATLADGSFIDKPPKGAKDPAAAFAALSKMLTWPLRNEKVKSGELAAVEACAFPGRTPLGTCTLEDGTKTEGGMELRWRLRRLHFDLRSTTDTDSGMKSCLKLGGIWAAPSADDSDAAHERLRQRAGSLREAAGQ